MNPGRRGRLTEADRTDWARYARHVAPLAGKVRPEAPPVAASGPAPAAASAVAAPRPPPPRSGLPPLGIGIQPPGVDNATWHKFRTGKLAAGRTLDLHGRTAHRAFHALETFLRAAQSDRIRCVEVITGRGSGEAGGVIRRELPLWLGLAEVRPLVLAAAHPHPANPGSVRLLLRRLR
jgi:DNA-nicking Smr family endonuclease